MDKKENHNSIKTSLAKISQVKDKSQWKRTVKGVNYALKINNV